jgi:hypothetical protein
MKTRNHIFIVFCIMLVCVSPVNALSFAPLGKLIKNIGKYIDDIPTTPGKYIDDIPTTPGKYIGNIPAVAGKYIDDIPKISRSIPRKSEALAGNAAEILKNNNVRREIRKASAALSKLEQEIYKKAKLIPGEINGRKVLIRTDIDLKHMDEFGLSNMERMKRGLAPIGSDGKPIQLHHVRQKNDGILAELTEAEHHVHFDTLHDRTLASEINRELFRKEREAHWMARVAELAQEVIK